MWTFHVEHIVRKVFEMRPALKILAENLKRIRGERGFTQASLSEAVHMSLRGYQKYEQGTTWPDDSYLDALAKVLKVGVAEFFREDSGDSKRLREAAIAGGLNREGVKAPEQFDDMFLFLSHYRKLGPWRRAVVSALVHDDLAYAESIPPIVPVLSSLLKATKSDK